ncbi:Putative 4,5-dihydroxyphthalate dehydrogenase [Pontiella desulfatans]|uniref:4,5-dihydroxyphthalate dehydrogenase n=2 Tax=Pontiella desulfatans TaxID=2750659 RepID=A0A6C2U5W8_PONDE|nr:Putative 4,5-dihydroxyphthalate dehydrogenase [Pontiella desulfatans]
MMNSKKNSLSRRNLLRSTGVAAAAVAAPTVIPSSALGFGGFTAPSNRITLGMVGFGLMMKGHFSNMLGRKEVQILAVCDVDTKKREEAKGKVDSKYGNNDCACYNEHEKIMERRDIDACFVITPDHWHVPISMDAIRSGKDVYVEKPMSLTIREGRMLSDACRRHGAILQVGSQQRSEYSFGKAVEMVRNGWIGKVHTVYARLGRFPDGKVLPEEEIPEGFDYDRWLGSTPWYPYNKNRVLGNYGGGWRSYWEYGSRKNGDWGAHHYDIIQWALGMDHSGPEFFFPIGYNGSTSQGYKYKNGPTIYRDSKDAKMGSMIEFHGENGSIGVGRSGDLKSIPGELKNKPLAPSEIHLQATMSHHQNFLDGIRTRKRTIADVEIGHRTASICHLSAISERLKRPINWNPATEEIVGDAEASKWLDRPRRAPYTL